VVTEGQVALASRVGADAVLLIAKALRPDALDALVRSCISCGIEPLVEVHDEADTAKLSGIGAFDAVRLVGVNCRDLRTLKTDLGVLSRLRPAIPDGKVVVAESGIRTVEDLRKVRSADAILVGSMLMAADELDRALEEVVQACRRVRS